MRKRPKFNKLTVYFIIICTITLLFIGSPLLIRIPFVYKVIRGFLSVFKSSNYKSTYIEAIGSVLGTFLAITGAIWTQSIFDTQEKKAQTEKNALIMYYDFKFALKSIEDIMKVIYPMAKCNVLPGDETIVDLFRAEKRKHRIYIDSNWRQLVTSLRDDLTVDEIREAQIIYSKLSMICMSFNASITETSRKEDNNSYLIMHDMIAVTAVPREPDVYEISIKKEIVSLIVRVAELAHIETAGGAECGGTE